MGDFMQGAKQGAGRIAGQALAQKAIGALRDFNDTPVTPVAGASGGAPIGGGAAAEAGGAGGAAAAGGEAAGAAAAGGEAAGLAELLPLAL